MSLSANVFLLALVDSSVFGRGSRFGANPVKIYTSILSKNHATPKPFSFEQQNTRDRCQFFKFCLRISGGLSDLPETEDDEFSESIGDLPRDDANTTQQEINNLVVEMNSVLARLTTPTKVISCGVHHGCRLLLRLLSM
jgi:hypothetical protein